MRRRVRRRFGLKSSILCCAPMLSSGQWTQTHDGTGVAPAPRISGAVAMDLTKNRMYLYGGIASSGTFGDMWYYDLVANTWTQLNDGSVSSPTIRSVHNMVLDTSNDRLYIFAGQGGPSWHHRNDVWYLDVQAGMWMCWVAMLRLEHAINLANRTPSYAVSHFC